MDGILLINKPINLTSHDVINKLRRKLKIKRIGHAGTLDPFASGVLVVGVGQGTKCLQFLEILDKEYLGVIKLGIKTNTGDLTGEVIETKEVNELDENQINDVLTSFIGEQEQIPPMFSALKVEGKKLYELARKGVEIERKPRSIYIHSLSLKGYNSDEKTLTFTVKCSKGTYVRTLGEDIASKLNTVGHLISLTRTKVGDFKLVDCYDLEDYLDDKFISIKDALKHLKHYQVKNDIEEKMVFNGRKIKLKIKEDLVLILNQKEEPMAVYQRINENIFASLRGFN